MISAKQAADILQEYAPEHLPDLVVGVLSGRETLEKTGWDMPPEDPFIAILESTDHDVLRRAVLKGCIRLLAQLTEYCYDPSASLDPAVVSAIGHLTAAVTIAKPIELKRGVYKLLDFAIDDPHLSISVRSAIVRMAFSFVEADDPAAPWESCLLDPIFAAYGFNALLLIEPAHARVVQGLSRLWLRYLSGEVSVKVIELTRRWAASRSSSDEMIDDLAVNFLSKLIEAHRHLQESLLQVLESNGRGGRWAQRLRVDAAVEIWENVVQPEFGRIDSDLWKAIVGSDVCWELHKRSKLSGGAKIRCMSSGSAKELQLRIDVTLAKNDSITDKLVMTAFSAISSAINPHLSREDEVVYNDYVHERECTKAGV